MMKELYLSLFLSIAAASAYAATARPSYVVSGPDGREVTVTVITDDIIKVSNLLPGQIAAPVRMADQDKLPVPQRPKTIVNNDRERILVTTSGVTVRMVDGTGAVTITAGDDRAVSDSGERTTASGKQTLKLWTMGGGSFYGAGERGYSFNIAGDTMVMYNKQNYSYVAGEPRIKQMGITMPLFLSSAGYAIVFDDHAAATMTMTNPIVYTTEGREPVSYYFINGAGTLEGVTKALSALTGRQDLPPFWSLGYITSKYGYKTQAETLGVVDTLKTAGYPVDGIVLDLYWYGKEQDMGRLDWDPEQWPDYKKMLADLKKDGVNLVAISQPYVLRNGRGVDNYNYLAPRGMLAMDTTGKPLEVQIWVGKGGMFDVSNPETKKWLADRYKKLTDGGITGWWGDLGEPEVHPDSALHFNGETTRLYHNLYGNDWSEIIYDLFKTEYPNDRLMTMMRGGTTGLQRFDVFPWSTDVSRSWGGLEPQVTIMLNSGLSGLGYMSSDIGGFAIDENMPFDPELYVRWLQLGAFSPILRTHAQRTAEPYHYPDHQTEILEFVKERYRWLPYNYTLAYENATEGAPLVRPLNFYMPGSTFGDDITDEYLWGRDVLVAPVMKQGATEREVIFPEGMWIDMMNPQNLYQGGDTITYPAPLEVLPRFARAGAFIPMADYDMRNVNDYRDHQYLINYYPVNGVKSEYVLFEDDRASAQSLEKNEYALVTFKGDDNDNAITIEVTSKGSYPGQTSSKHLTFHVYNVPNLTKNVRVNGQKMNKQSCRYDSTSRTLIVSTAWQINEPLNIVIKK